MPISRRDLLGALALAAPNAAAQTTASGDRPNILYVILEDTGPHFACYGEPLVRTPNIDRFAAQGIRFTHAFSTAPVCSASRSALMSGRYQTNIGAHNHRTWEWHKQPLAAPAKHVCDWFRDAGYFTCNLQPPPGKKKAVNGAAGDGKVDLNFLSNAPDPSVFFDGYDWSRRKPDQPFFAHITIVETHKGPGWAIARQRPKSELVDPEKLKLASYYPDSPVARDEYANYLDAISLSDGYLGQLLARLEDDGLAKNTVVVVSSDHGPLFRGKQFVYDGGIRIPLMIRFPDGRRAVAVDDRFVGGIDIAPTLLGFAGIIPPAGAMRGQDIFGASRSPRSHIFAARDRMDTSIDRMRAVRTRQFKYIRNYFPGTPYMQHNEYKESHLEPGERPGETGQADQRAGALRRARKADRRTVRRSGRSRRSPESRGRSAISRHSEAAARTRRRLRSGERWPGDIRRSRRRLARLLRAPAGGPGVTELR